MGALFGSWVVFPLVMLVLVAGAGLLAQRASGVQLPPALIPPTGLAVVIVLSALCTQWDATARLATPACVAAALAGYALTSDRRRLVRACICPASVAAVGVFLVYGAPVLLSGAATFAGYIKLDDTSTWLAITDRAMSHGRSLAGLQPSTYEAALVSYLQSGYPLGSFLPWGIGHALTGIDLAWIFQPYEAFLAAMLALCAYELTRGAIRSTRLAAVAAFVAAQAALLYGYSQWGGVKELMAAVLIALVSALVAWSLRDGAALRRPVPLGAASAATLISLTIGGGAWIAVALAGGLALLAIQRRNLLEVIRPALLVIVVGGICAIPAFASAPSFLKGVGGLEAKSVAGTGEALGNLIQPLRIWQAVGIWPAGDFRVQPSHQIVTGILITLALIAAVYALTACARKRTYGLPLYVTTSIVGCALIAEYGSPWVDAKALASASPALLLAAIAGAVILLERTRPNVRAFAPALALAGTLLIGVAWSNALAYHDVNLAPRPMLRELEAIGHRFAGQGPALITDYQSYATRHFLRSLDVEGASDLRRRVIPTRSEPGGLQKGEYADIDEFAPGALDPYRLLVLRRSPTASRPPSNFRRIWTGNWYEVWRRDPHSPTVIDHEPLGNAVNPVAAAPCADVKRLAREAGAAGRLATVFRSPAYALALNAGVYPTSWTLPGSSGLAPGSAGKTSGSFTITLPGRYGVWLGGSYRSQISAKIDGHISGRARHQLTYAGGYSKLGSTDLGPGDHTYELDYAGPDLSPGSGGPAYPMGPLVLATGDDVQPVTYLRPRDAASLCGKSLDWIEAVS